MSRVSLFFFFSGYFVPKSSFDKRGTHVFLVERAKRLGIPFVLIAFVVIGPYSTILQEDYISVSFLLSRRRTVCPHLVVWLQYTPDVTWFLQQLIVLSIAYAFACGKGLSPNEDYLSVALGLLWNRYSTVRTRVDDRCGIDVRSFR